MITCEAGGDSGSANGEGGCETAVSWSGHFEQITHLPCFQHARLSWRDEMYRKIEMLSKNLQRRYSWLACANTGEIEDEDMRHIARRGASYS